MPSGALVDLEDKEGRVALHYAANGEHIKMARLLLQVMRAFKM